MPDQPIIPVNLDALRPPQLVELVVRFQERENIMKMLDEGLMEKLAARDDLTQGQREIIKQWKAWKSQAMQDFAAELGRIVSRPTDDETTSIN